MYVRLHEYLVELTDIHVISIRLSPVKLDLSDSYLV